MGFPCLAEEGLLSRASGSLGGASHRGRTAGYKSWEEVMGCGEERRGSRYDSW